MNCLPIPACQHTAGPSSWIIPGYYSSVPNITQYYQYYIILPILHNITNQRFTNITQYYISNITQYSIGGIKYQYYSILLILLNITYSILLNIPNPQNCAFPIQYVSIFIILQAISNIPQYSSILAEQLGGKSTQWKPVKSARNHCEGQIM